MSYQVLARKWRPRTFREMIGQEHVLRALINALDHNRLHHAYLFTGTRGVGKTSIARILAKCLNCETGVSSEPCGECSACLEIAQGRFVDLIEVDAASRTKVEDTRELLDNVQYAPTRGRFKIYLIDEVHMLSNHSFNALLKTLEEPPEHVKFLLATTDPQKLPVTILSRCLQFNLKNLSPEKIVAHLTDVLQKESIPFDDSALWLLARSADGSMRDGLSLTDQSISFGGGKISEPEVSAMLGTIDHKLIEQLISGLISSDGSAILNAVAAFAEHAPDFDVALSDLITLLHRIAIAQAMPDALDNSYGDKTTILSFAAKLPPEDVQLFYQTALLGRRDLPLSPSARAGFEMTLLRMLAFKPQGVADVPTQKIASSLESEVIETEKKPQASNKPDITTDVLTEPSVTPDVNNAAPDAFAEPKTANITKLPAIDPIKSNEVEEPVAKTSEPHKAHLRAQIKEIVGAEGFTKPVKSIDKPKPSNDTPERESAPSNVPSSSLAGEIERADEPVVGATIKKIQLEDITVESWPRIYPYLEIKGLLQSTASNTVFLGRQAYELDFALDEKKSSLFDESHSEKLSAHLSEYFSLPIRARIHLKAITDGSETPAAYSLRINAEKKQDAVNALQADPIVQSLQSEFGATLDESTVVVK